MDPVRDELLPDSAEVTEGGWRIDIAGVLDPRPAVPWLAIGMLVGALVIGALSTWWMVLPFAAIAATTVSPQGGTLIHGFAVRRGQLEILGLKPVSLGEVSKPRANGSGLTLELQGVPHTLVLRGRPTEWFWIATTLQAELEGFGTPADVPAQIAGLREIEA